MLTVFIFVRFSLLTSENSGDLKFLALVCDLKCVSVLFAGLWLQPCYFQQCSTQSQPGLAYSPDKIQKILSGG